MIIMKSQATVVRSYSEFYAEVTHRARCTLGLRGVKNSNKIKINASALNKYYGLTTLVLTDDEMAAIARRVVEDTMDYLQY